MADISANRREFNRVDFWILDSLSDDYESIIQILPCVRQDAQGITTEEILDHIADLLECGYVRLGDELVFSKYVILMDLRELKDEYSNYWFGMTPAGCDLWQKLASDFGYEQIDWNEMWGASIDYEAQKGNTVATTLERCEEKFNTLNSGRADFMIDRASFRVSRVEVWHPKYYKTLRNGWQIDFNLVRVGGATSEPNSVSPV